MADTQGATGSRELQGEATRARLVDVATRALEQGGEQAIKVREIASALGVSVGAVYHHFESREDLIVAARVAQFDGVISGDLEAIRDLVDRSDDVATLRRGMQYLTRAAHSPARSRFRRLRAELAGVAGHNPELSAALGAAQDRCTTGLSEIVETAQRKGLVRAGLDSRSVATFLQAVTLGLVLNDINLANPVVDDAWFDFTDHVYESLLAADG